MKKEVNIIVAVDNKFGISKNGNIPWHIPEDLKLFKDITSTTQNKLLENIIIMGSNTAKSLTNVLPNRINYVLTKNEETKLELEKKGFICFNNINECMESSFNNKLAENIFLIGGEQIYNWGLNNPNVINNIYLTYIDSDYNCDKFINVDLLTKNFVRDLYSVIITDKFNFEIWNVQKNREEQKYLDLLKYIKNCGHKRQTRNGITYSTFGKTLEFDLKNNSFPLLTTKKMAIKSIFEELKFFLLGQTDNEILKNKNVHIWDSNTTKEFINKNNLPYEENDLGPMYGYQWRYFNAEYYNCKNDYINKGCDQLQDVINLIKTDPFSRRILMTSYNPAQAKLGVLYPCHGISIQFYIEEINNKYHLDCLMHQRSADSFLGVPFNITSYALLVYLLCNHINSTGGILEEQNIYPGKLLMVFGDMHIYDEHLEAVEKQISREPYLFPQIKINYNLESFNKEGVGSIGEMEFKDIEILDYKYHDPIKAQMIA